MEEKVFCPYCGNKVTPGAKFCRHCGKSLVSEQRVKYVPTPTPKDVIPEKTIEETTVSEDKYTKESKVSTESKDSKELNKPNEPKEQVTSFMKTAEEKAKQTGQAAKKQAQQLKNQYDQKDTATKKKIFRIGGGILIACVLIFGFMWYQGKDYRTAMKAGETYFERGEYGDAEYYFKQAHDEKPGNKKALTMLDHADYLGNIWTNINEGWGNKTIADTCDEIEHKMNDIKDKDIKLKYDEALTRIVNSSDYELEQRIRARLEAGAQ